jgi:hypothetical protein
VRHIRLGVLLEMELAPLPWQTAKYCLTSCF